MIIPFNFVHVFHPEASPVENALVLRRLLDCLTGLNVDYLQHHRDTPALYKSGVRYRRQECWECIPTLFERKWGDCKSLACALAAEYIMTGIPARTVFRWKVNQEPGGNDWTMFHILVQCPGGFEDPSKVLGMGKDENAKYYRNDGSVMACDNAGIYSLR